MKKIGLTLTEAFLGKFKIVECKDSGSDYIAGKLFLISSEEDHPSTWIRVYHRNNENEGSWSIEFTQDESGLLDRLNCKTLFELKVTEFFRFSSREVTKCEAIFHPTVLGNSSCFDISKPDIVTLMGEALLNWSKVLEQLKIPDSYFEK